MSCLPVKFRSCYDLKLEAWFYHSAPFRIACCCCERWQYIDGESRQDLTSFYSLPVRKNSGAGSFGARAILLWRHRWHMRRLFRGARIGNGAHSVPCTASARQFKNALLAEVTSVVSGLPLVRAVWRMPVQPLPEDLIFSFVTNQFLLSTLLTIE